MTAKSTAEVNDEEVKLFMEVENILTRDPINIANDPDAKRILIEYLRRVREKVQEATTAGKSLTAKVTGKRPTSKKVEGLLDLPLGQTPTN